MQDRLRNQQKRLDDEKPVLGNHQKEWTPDVVGMCRRLSEYNETVDVCSIPTEETAASQSLDVATTTVHEFASSTPGLVVFGGRSFATRAHLQFIKFTRHAAKDVAVAPVVAPIPEWSQQSRYQTTGHQHNPWNAQDQHQQAQQSNQHQRTNQDLKGYARRGPGSRLSESFGGREAPEGTREDP